MNTYTVSKCAFAWEVLCLGVHVCRCPSRAGAEDVAAALNLAEAVPTLVEALAASTAQLQTDSCALKKVIGALALARRLCL